MGRGKGEVMGLLRKAVQALTEPRESKRPVTMWDCPLCPALFWSQAKADAHVAQCRGE